MAKAKRNRPIKPEIQKAKSALRSRMYRYNKKLRAQGVDSRLEAHISLAGIRTKRDLERATKRFERLASDTPVKNAKGLWVTASEQKKFERTQKAANQRIRRAAKERQKEKLAIDAKFGKQPPPKSVQRQMLNPATFKRDINSFDNLQALLDYEERMSKAKGPQGLNPEELKEALLKAIRGEVFVMEASSRFRGGVNNPLATFIDKELTPQEVQHLFGDKLSFEFVYGPERGLVKEYEIIHQILSGGEYPELKAKWDESYEEGYEKYIQDELAGVTEIAYDDEGKPYDPYQKVRAQAKMKPLDVAAEMERRKRL